MHPAARPRRGQHSAVRAGACRCKTARARRQRRRSRRHPGQQLADADARAGNVQAVGAQALDERAADAVPHGVEQNELAVKPPLVLLKPEV